MIKKSLPFFASDFESVFALNTSVMTGKILSCDFYPMAIYFECKFCTSQSIITRIKTDRLHLRGLDLGKPDVIYWLA